MTNSRALGIEYFKNLAIERLGKCLSDVYKNNSTHLEWECEYSHRWSAAPKAIKKGNWCPHCYNQTDARRAVKFNPNKINEIKEKAIANGGKLLSEVYVNNRSPLLFECASGHQWETIWKCVNKGAWCPECALANSKILNDDGIINPNYNGDSFKYLEELKQIAKQRGGECLSAEYTGQHGKAEFSCSVGHLFKIKPNNIKNGQWCSACSSSISERICRIYFEAIFEMKFPKEKPDWLINTTGNRLELDGFCKELNLAFEHQGMQHYVETRGQEKLEAIKKRDDVKKYLCKTNNVKLIEIPALFVKTKLSDLEEFIYNQLSLNNIKFKRLDTLPDIGISYNEKLFGDEELNRVKQLVANKGSIKETEFLGNGFKYTCICCKCNYEWMSSLTNLKAGRWCPACANKIPFTIADMQTMAAQNGGTCLSTEYTNNYTKLTWQCGQCTNIWEASYNAVQAGTWCPPCSIKRRANKKKLSIGPYQEAAIKKGGKLLSTEYNSCFDKLLWQCAAGHLFNSRADQVKNTSQWCPHCWKKRQSRGKTKQETVT